MREFPCVADFERGHLATLCPKRSRKNRKIQKSTWWVGSNDRLQVISKKCGQPLQVSENPSQPNPPLQSQDSRKESIPKPKKEAYSPQVSDEGLQIQSSPQPSACWADQIDDVEVPDQEKIEAPDQDNPENPCITSTSTNANESWTIIRKNKTSHATSQPMIT